MLRRRKIKDISCSRESDHNILQENNFCRNARSRLAGSVLCGLCPVPITFLGFEVGFGVISGDKLDHSDALYRVLEDHGSAAGRHSWDPMTVVLALIGDEEKAGYDTVVGYASVDPESGANRFIRDENGKHRFVVKKYPNEYYADQINHLIQ